MSKIKKKKRKAAAARRKPTRREEQRLWKKKLESKRRRAKAMEVKRVSDYQRQRQTSPTANIENQLRLNIKRELQQLDLDDSMVAMRIAKLAQISLTAVQSVFTVKVQKLQPAKDPSGRYLLNDKGSEYIQETVPFSFQTTAESMTSADVIFKELLRQDALQGEIARYLRLGIDGNAKRKGGEI